MSPRVPSSSVGRPNYSSAFVASGTAASVTVGPLTADIGYHWQARARDDGAVTSDWVSFPGAPGNAESEVDFSVATPPRNSCSRSSRVAPSPEP